MGLLEVLKILHLTAMAVWFGAGLFLVSDIRRAMAGSSPDLAPFEHINRMARIPPLAGVVTLLSGVGLLLTSGGNSSASWQMIVSLILTLVLLAIGGAVLQPTLEAIHEHVRTGGDRPRADELVRRLRMVGGVQHLLWFSVLVLMVVRT